MGNCEALSLLYSTGQVLTSLKLPKLLLGGIMEYVNLSLSIAACVRSATNFFKTRCEQYDNDDRKSDDEFDEYNSVNAIMYDED